MTEPKPRISQAEPKPRISQPQAQPRVAVTDGQEPASRTGTPVPARQKVTAPGYVHAIHPDHGEPVVYVPGEQLPDWAADVLDAGRFTRDGRTGVITLEDLEARS